MLWLDLAIHVEPVLVPLTRDARPASTFVNNARNQGPECVEATG
jgi:hypothetical protein